MRPLPTLRSIGGDRYEVELLDDTIVRYDRTASALSRALATACAIALPSRGWACGGTGSRWLFHVQPAKADLLADGVQAALEHDIEAVLDLCCEIAEQRPLWSASPPPPVGEGRLLGGPLHGQDARARANYLDDDGKAAPMAHGDREWLVPLNSGRLPVEAGYARIDGQYRHWSAELHQHLPNPNPYTWKAS